MIAGYARVLPGERTLALQQDALLAADCERIFIDTVKGPGEEHPGLADALAHLGAGDTLVVWRLDRLGRSLHALIELITTLDERGIEFKSLDDKIDSTAGGGHLIFHVFRALAEFERELVRARTRAGLAAARASGKKGGHPRVEALDSPDKVEIAQRLYNDRSNSIEDICRTLGVSRATLYRYITPSSRARREKAEPS